MKKFFLCLLILLIILVYKPLTFTTLSQDNIEFEVVIIKDKIQVSRTITAYSILRDVLTEEDLDGVDLQRINLSKILNHQDVIVLPLIEDTPCISLNHANVEQLVQLTGVGNAVALRIIDYRENVSTYKQLEDVMKVKGIKEKLYEKIKDSICL